MTTVLKDRLKYLLARLGDGSTHAAMAGALTALNVSPYAPPSYHGALWAWMGAHTLFAVLLK
jgi:hypothetical protein